MKTKNMQAIEALKHDAQRNVALRCMQAVRYIHANTKNDDEYEYMIANIVADLLAIGVPSQVICEVLTDNEFNMVAYLLVDANS